MKIAIVHTHFLGDDFKMPEYLNKDGIKTVQQRILSGDPWGYKNHKAYAEHHGYEFIEDKGGWVNTKTPDWVLWQAALRVLKKGIDADWIWFSANDFIYADFNLKLEDYIQDVPDSAILCTGTYMADLGWKVLDPKADIWICEKTKDLGIGRVHMQMLSGWVQFIRNCPESIEFLEKLDADTRINTCPRLRDSSFCGDAFISLWYQAYPEDRKKWHLIPTEDIIRIPNQDESMQKWNTTWNLKQYSKKHSLLLFATCHVPYNETLHILEKYTEDALNGI
jgi:hypothetical protein